MPEAVRRYYPADTPSLPNIPPIPSMLLEKVNLLSCQRRRVVVILRTVVGVIFHRAKNDIHVHVVLVAYVFGILVARAGSVIARVRTGGGGFVGGTGMGGCE